MHVHPPTRRCSAPDLVTVACTCSFLCNLAGEAPTWRTLFERRFRSILDHSFGGKAPQPPPGMSIKSFYFNFGQTYLGASFSRDSQSASSGGQPLPQCEEWMGVGRGLSYTRMHTHMSAQFAVRPHNRQLPRLSWVAHPRKWRTRARPHPRTWRTPARPPLAHGATSHMAARASAATGRVLVKIGGRCYDVTDFLDEHPGI